MAKGQKEAVVEQVIGILPNFVKFQDSAISALSNDQLETIKHNVFQGIVNGDIEYGKDRTNQTEVRAYARSMVMNHLKKAKELNGGNSYVKSSSGSTNTVVKAVKPIKNKNMPKGVNPNLLPDDLREFAETLV